MGKRTRAIALALPFALGAGALIAWHLGFLVAGGYFPLFWVLIALYIEVVLDAPEQRWRPNERVPLVLFTSSGIGLLIFVSAARALTS